MRCRSGLECTRRPSAKVFEMALTARAPAASAHVPGVADQAAGLRSMLNRVALRVLPIVGGGSGVGKNAIVARLAQSASRTQRVVVLDQTPGEVAAQLGMATQDDLQDLLTGRLEFGEVAVRVANWRLVPAQRGLTELLAAGAAGPDFFRGFLHLNEPAGLLILNLADQEMALPKCGDGVAGDVAAHGVAYRRLCAHEAPRAVRDWPGWPDADSRQWRG